MMGSDGIIGDGGTVQPVAPVPIVQTYYVLMSTATSVEVLATSPAEAAVLAVRTAPSLMKDEELRWAVHSVSDKPYYIAADEEEAGAIAKGLGEAPILPKPVIISI